MIAGIDIVARLAHMLDVFFAWLPRLVGGLVVLLIGYFVARIISRILVRVLGRSGFDSLLSKGALGRFLARLGTPSKLVGTIVFWVLFFGSFGIAAQATGITALTSFVGHVYAYVPNVIAALAILIVAALLANIVGGLLKRTLREGPLSAIAVSAAPVLILIVASFMALEQLKIAQGIVIITYAAIVGSIALGAALAFGLGGREHASAMLGRATEGGNRPIVPE